MQKPEVREINIQSPIKAVGKIFTGDYAKSPEHIMELQAFFKETGIQFIENKVMGVYYDDPSRTNLRELTSFQGVFLTEKEIVRDVSVMEISLSGKYICTKVSGDPAKSIYEGYGAIFNYIEKNQVTLESTAGYQVATFENGTVTTEIYMKIV